MARCRSTDLRRYFRADAAFANLEVYEFLEAEGYLYPIRFPANTMSSREIAYLRPRPAGRPPQQPIHSHGSFMYWATTLSTPGRMVAKLEWHAGELLQRVGFIVTNLRRDQEDVARFYNGRGAHRAVDQGPGTLAAAAGLSCERGALVANPAAGEAHQDREQSPADRAVRGIPDRGGCRTKVSVPDDSGSDAKTQTGQAVGMKNVPPDLGPDVGTSGEGVRSFGESVVRTTRSTPTFAEHKSCSRMWCSESRSNRGDCAVDSSSTAHNSGGCRVKW